MALQVRTNRKFTLGNLRPAFPRSFEETETLESISHACGAESMGFVVDLHGNNHANI
jgi:hypothetical protein